MVPPPPTLPNSEWFNIDFVDIKPGDFIYAETEPVSQGNLGHPQADRTVVGTVTHLGETMGTTMLRDASGNESVLAYDNLGDRVMIFLKKLITVTHRQIVNRETGKLGKRGIKRKHEFGKMKMKLNSINKDIKFLQ